jgi:hypothetical protein
MSRFFTLALAVTLTACIDEAAWSLGGQAGGASGGGGASGSGGTSGAEASAGAAGQAGTTGGTQAGAAGQVGAGQAGAGQAGAGQVPSAGFGIGQGTNIGRTPFFTDPRVRQQLNLDDTRFNELHRARQEAFMRFNQGVTGLNPNLTEQQRMQQMMALENQFNQNFNTALDTTFTDPRLRNRFNQLNWQFQGFGAFTDPFVRQQLDLTPQQQRQFRQLNTEWRRQLQRLRRAGNDQNPGLTQEQIAQMQQQFRQQIQTLLTPEQQQNWNQLIGQPFPVTPGWDVFDQQPQNPAGVVLKNGANARVGARTQAGAGTQDSQSQNQGTQEQGNQGTVR